MKEVKASTARIRKTTPFNHRVHGETYHGKSLTVANEAFSIKEILERWTRGIDPGLSKVGHEGSEDADFDDVDLEKIGRMDRPTQLRIHQEHLEKVYKARKALLEAENQAKKFEIEKGLNKPENEEK